MYIELNKKCGKALYIQLYEAISEEIAAGHLHNGTKLPTRRALAQQLGISQNTVDGAYKMLLDTGYVLSIPRQGYIISFKNSAYDNSMPWEINAPEEVVFSPNGIDTSAVNRAAYAKLLRNIAYNDGADIFSYVDKSGEFALRRSISKYLYSFRDFKCSPDRIIIGAGAEYLLTSLALLFSDSSGIIMENPCDLHFYRALIDYKNKVFSLPTNIDKFDFDALRASKGNILFIEADSRFPRSCALNESERAELLSWANENDERYIIENGCDREIQWDTYKSLYSMDRNNKVIYLGSFSRSFCPAVKTSYMILPPRLLELWKNGHAYYYALTSKIEQLTLAEFIDKGYFTKHVKAMRRIYKEKFKYLTDTFSNAFGNDFHVCSASGRTYIDARFDSIGAEEIKQLARRNGVKLLSMNSYNINKLTAPIKNDRLVLGFGDLTKEKIKLGVKLLENCLEHRS
jgi:GntR family transcriptional regulator/MocR family aminotransferase